MKNLIIITIFITCFLTGCTKDSLQEVNNQTLPNDSIEFNSKSNSKALNVTVGNAYDSGCFWIGSYEYEPLICDVTSNPGRFTLWTLGDYCIFGYQNGGQMLYVTGVDSGGEFIFKSSSVHPSNLMSHNQIINDPRTLSMYTSNGSFVFKSSKFNTFLRTSSGQVVGVTSLRYATEYDVRI